MSLAQISSWAADLSSSKSAPIYTLSFALLGPLLIWGGSSTLHRRRIKKSSVPVAPGKLPFFGHALSLTDTEEFVSILSKWGKEVGNETGVYQFNIFSTRWIVLCSPDSFLQAFKLRPYKVRRARMLEQVFSSLGIYGMFDAEGHQWMNDRRIVSPVLNKKNLEDYFQYIKLVAKRLVTKWEHSPKAVSAFSDLANYSFDAVALSILGLDINSLNDPNAEFASDIQELLNVINKRALSPIHYWKWLPFDFDGGNAICGKIKNVIRELIHNYRTKRGDSSSDSNAGSSDGSGQPSACLKKLIDLSEGTNARLDDERVIGNLMTLIVAGTDTTSITVATCIWEIANCPDLQQELWEEVAKSEVDMDSLSLHYIMNSFPRLYSLLFEVLRMKNPGPFIGLEPSDEPVEILGEMYGPGTILCALTQTHSKMAASEVPLGPDGEGPDKFCPHRWLVHGKDGLTVTQPTNKYGAFMPFGSGARVCPGASLAKVEAITILVTILSKFEITPIQNHPPIRSVTRFTQTFDGEIILNLKLR